MWRESNLDDKLGLTLLFSICGVVAFLAGVDGIRKFLLKRLECTSSVFGTVVEIKHWVGMRTGSSSGGSRIYSYDYGVVSFNVGELHYTVNTPSWEKKPTCAVGDMLRVHYNPNDPQDAFVGDTPYGLSNAIIIGVAGAFLIVVSILFVLGVIG